VEKMKLDVFVNLGSILVVLKELQVLGPKANVLTLDCVAITSSIAKIAMMK
jgi:uncharacterized membrane protein